MRDKNSSIPLLRRYGLGSATNGAQDTFWCRGCGCNRPVGYLGYGDRQLGTARVRCQLGHEAYIVVPIARARRWEEEAR